MVLSALSTYPDLWAAGVNIVGISSFVTFLENTSDYRRAHREAEYGSLATDRAFWSASRRCAMLPDDGALICHPRRQ